MWLSVKNQTMSRKLQNFYVKYNTVASKNMLEWCGSVAAVTEIFMPFVSYQSEQERAVESHP